MKNANNVLHERQCMHCDHRFTVEIPLKEHIKCVKCGAGAYPTDYYEQQIRYYIETHGVDKDESGFYASRDSIGAYCGCHNAALCYEFNEHAPFNAACHTETLQIACMDLGTFLMERRYDELTEKLNDLEKLIAQ